MDDSKEYSIEEEIPRLERIFQDEDFDTLKELIGGMRETMSSVQDDDESVTTETHFSENNVKASIDLGAI